MARAGIKQLYACRYLRLSKFEGISLDQRGWLPAVGIATDVDLGICCDALGYDGRPELLSMHCCLCLTSRLRQILAGHDAAWWDHHKPSWHAARWNFRLKRGFDAHPLTIVSKVVRELD